ncbi:DivIVA domain-containing protein [Micromonospora sagamiensis]|uniref:DivIVA domain-containing protein n=1 Tax=Micromonospora sagamiensis TaxID=47875 RepID=UPI001E49B9A0|nr:DivIVA domain-containing protein [Micromonospora sagamiensis]
MRPPSTSADTASRGHPPLTPDRIRDRRFTARRRGLDPDEIAAFLARVADELAVARTALTAVREENVRIKDALRSWQSAQIPTTREPGRW